MAWANQSPTYVMLMDLERARLVLDISKKIRELKYAAHSRDDLLIAAIEEELRKMELKYWNMPFKCPFCHAKTPERPDICPSCGCNFNKLFKDRKYKESI